MPWPASRTEPQAYVIDTGTKKAGGRVRKDKDHGYEDNR